jgi:prepilin-type N-terminal cleavage/methylation domain-containing protein
MSRQKPFNRQSGLTLMEVLVVMLITSALLIMSYEILEDAARTSVFVEVRNDLPVQAQSAANALQGDVFQASTIFDTTGFGPNYLAALKLPVSAPMLTNSKMPTTNAAAAPTAAELVPDDPNLANPQFVGNCLLIVRQLQPIPVFTDSAKTITMLADRYQFEFYYLTKRTTRNFAGSGYFIDMMRGKSPIFADFTQINALTAAQKTQVIGNLAAAKDPNTNIATPITRAWNPGVDVPSAFFDLQITSPFTVAVVNAQIDMSSTNRSAINNTLSLLPALSGGRIAGFSNYSVAFRPSAAVSYPLSDAVPKYATFDPSKPAFPSGVEFLLVGAQGSRRLLCRVVLMAEYSVGKLASREVINVTSVK